MQRNNLLPGQSEAPATPAWNYQGQTWRMPIHAFHFSAGTCCWTTLEAKILSWMKPHSHLLQVLSNCSVYSRAQLQIKQNFFPLKTESKSSPTEKREDWHVLLEMTGKRSSGKAEEIKMAEKLCIFSPVLEQSGRPKVMQAYNQNLLVFNPT